jgi:hypothetical protein
MRAIDTVTMRQPKKEFTVLLQKGRNCKNAAHLTV